MEIFTIIMFLVVALIGIFVTIRLGIKVLQIAFYIVGLLAGLKYLGGT